MKTFHLIIIYSFTLSLAHFSTAQDLSSQLKIARSLDQAGEYEKAIAIYETLYQKYPDDLHVLYPYRDACLKNRDYDKAVELVRQMLNLRPDDPTLQSVLAQTLFKKGSQDEAMAVWNQILEKNPKQRNVYQIVAGALEIERLYDEAIQVYQKARVVFGQKYLFSIDLARLYGLTIQYGPAANEYLHYLAQDKKRFSIVEKQLQSFPKSNRVYRDVLAVLERKTDDTALYQMQLQLLMNYQLSFKKFDDALNTALRVDKMAKPGQEGTVIESLAERAFDLGYPETSINAYKKLITLRPGYSNMDQVIFGLARSYEAGGDNQEAAQRYKEMLQHFPKSRYCAQALYRSGKIYMDVFFDPVEAAGFFRKLNHSFPHTTEGQRALLDVANCYTLQGKLEEAEKIYDMILKEKDKYTQDIETAARVHLGETYYYQLKFDKAFEVLDGLVHAAAKDLSDTEPALNDGLRLRLLLQQTKNKDQESLKWFARSALLEKQNRLAEAADLLGRLPGQFPASPILNYIFLEKGEIHIRMHQYKKALSSLDSIISRFPMNLITDRAYERKGWALEAMGKPEEAMHVYEELLIRYPQSFFADEIRERIRRIEESK